MTPLAAPTKKAGAVRTDAGLLELFTAIGDEWRGAGYFDALDERQAAIYVPAFDDVEKIAARRAMYADCLAHVGDLPATSGCDLGCWLGFSAAILRALGAGRVYGVEIDPVLVETAEAWRARHGVDGVGFRPMPGGVIPLASGTIDWVLVNQVMCNAMLDTFEPTLREAFRILRPGGRIIICESNNPHCPDTWTRLERSYRVAELGTVGSADRPDGRNYHERLRLIRALAPEIDADAAARLARETCYLWREPLAEAVRVFGESGRTPGQPFDPAAKRPPCRVNGVANGNVTDPFAIAGALETIGFGAPTVTVSPRCAAVDNDVLWEQLRASQGFYLFARKPGAGHGDTV